MQFRLTVLVVVCLLLILAALALPALAQTVPATSWIYGYVGNRAAWLRLDPAVFIVSGEVVSVKAPPAPPSAARVYGEKLAYDATVTGWKVPAGARNVEVFVNGLHYWPGVQYTLDAGTIKPLNTNMLSDFDVRINYDPQ